MSKFAIDEHVLPRPVERLPEYAHAKARQTLADRITDAFGLSPSSSSAIANAVVEPSEVRKSIGEPSDPDVEKISVPGGTLLGIRTSVWARRIMPDPRNPRLLPSRCHPFAVEPGSGGEEAKFRPVPEPRPLNPGQPRIAELAVDVESRHHLTWAAQQAAVFVLAENDWRRSIASQGVMEAVWLVATTYLHADGSAPATTLTTVEGSSRSTAVHNLLDIRSSDVPYDENEARFRADIRRMNEVFDRGPTAKDLIDLRCERIPALILVGFRPHHGGTTGFPTAIKSLVALRHVDPPKPWGEGPENESLADEVLDELYRRDLISATERDYYAGSCTRQEARAAHLPDDPVLRAAKIVQLFTGKDDSVDEAVRVAVTSQSTRKRITTNLMNELATALILRAVDKASSKIDVDQIRRYLRHAFGKSVHRAAWRSTGRTTEQLVKEALQEVSDALSAPIAEDPGPTSLELAVRASYPLIVSGRLNADRGSANNDQPDRRTPGEVLDAMRRSPQGIHQLGQALRDFASDAPIRAVDEAGDVKEREDGSGAEPVSDIYLRREFPPPGKVKAARPGETATDRYHNGLVAMDSALQTLRLAFEALRRVVGEDGQPLVDRKGLEPRLSEPWRELLTDIDEEMLIWTRTFKKAHSSVSSKSAPTTANSALVDDDPYEDEKRDDVDEWDNPAQADVANDAL